MQSIKHGDELVSYNVQKLPRSSGDLKTVYRVSLGVGEKARAVDVPFDDFVAKVDDPESARKRTEYISALPEKALKAALDVVYPLPAARAPVEAPTPAPEEHEKAEHPRSHHAKK